MSDYAIFFDYNNSSHRLPVNPEELKITKALAVEKFEILKLGQIAIPTHAELNEYSFECELPKEDRAYIKTKNEFRSPDYYLNLFETWRKNLVPVRFIATNGIGDDTNTLVLIEELEISEKAGEEGDKYVSLKLLEYKEFNIKTQTTEIDKSTGKKKRNLSTTTNPKNTGFHIVQKDETLWGISKKYYGKGSLYNKIFNANKDKIKNPSLIYPGWKLVIPK
jgi:nucleoid-associated protein YgaU